MAVALHDLSLQKGIGYFFNEAISYGAERHRNLYGRIKPLTFHLDKLWKMSRVKFKQPLTSRRSVSGVFI